MKKNNYGFTLVELLITVAILSIIAAIAIPNYQNTVRRSNRADAKAALNTLANELARYRAADSNRSYTTDMAEFSLSSAVSTAATSESGHYSVAISAGGAGIANSYSITATHTGTQVADTDCKTFTITSAGVRSSKNTAAGDSTAECW